MFGGYRDGPLDDLWAYRPGQNAWARLEPQGVRPPARDRHSAVWDDATGRMLVFGGTGLDPLADLWSYDPAATNRWTEVQPAGERPTTHFDHGAVWDPATARMLVFGGYGGRASHDLWSYQPAANAWRKLRPWGAPPPTRSAYSVAWDPAASQMLTMSAFLGGRSNDLWAYRPATNAWVQPAPSRPAPSARQQHAAAWSARAAAMFVFGGYRSGSEFLNDLWSYRPATRSWIPLQPDGTAPSGRSGHTAVWDDRANRLLVFGGYSVQGYHADLWSYRPDTNTWEELARNGQRPPPRDEHVAVWDTERGQMLVHGGARDGRPVDDLWAYLATTDSWVELEPEDRWPAARFRHTAVWDPDADRMLVFAGYGGGFPGGYLNDVWSYRPTAKGWERLEPLTEGMPASRARHVAVWDSTRQRMLAMGGFAGGIEYLSDLWAFDPVDSTWRQLRPATGPGARSAHVGAWDAAGSQLLIHGGSGSALSDELWLYAPLPP
jgi:N-acetylneuraminic acid mutarotase